MSSMSNLQQQHVDGPFTWGWSSSAHWRRSSSSRWILRWSSSDAGARGRCCHSSSALWGHDLKNQSQPSASETTALIPQQCCPGYLLRWPAHTSDGPCETSWGLRHGSSCRNTTACRSAHAWTSSNAGQWNPSDASL